MKEKQMKYNKIKCKLCGKRLTSPLDLILYNIEDGETCEVEFRHQSTCDDRRFVFSRHVKEGFDDILKEFKKYTSSLVEESWSASEERELIKYLEESC